MSKTLKHQIEYLSELVMECKNAECKTQDNIYKAASDGLFHQEYGAYLQMPFSDHGFEIGQEVTLTVGPAKVKAIYKGNDSLFIDYRSDFILRDRKLLE